MNQAHHTTGLLFVSAPCAGRARDTRPGPTPTLTSEESGHAEVQVNDTAAPALLREAACVDTQKTKSLCCAAAGIISSLGAPAESQVPHDRLRQAAPPDTTLIASDRPHAQPVKGYTHNPDHAPTPEAQAVCDRIADAIYSKLEGSAAGVLTTVEGMALAIHHALQLAGTLDPIAADLALDAAKQQFSAAIQRAYPTGSRLRAVLGGHLVTIEVTGYGAWWSQPGYLFGTNPATGKVRKLYHRDVVEVLS
ncbi:hypothetical protein [Pseudomonas huaxiensis]|uniref:hypothetical protein n=1 Tax=Pseudomonas huaxiensis TaxID=2213017 RepID=UPI0015AAA8C8|nr:hypothetical protein [Pseudomonas huaxiensis]